MFDRASIVDKNFIDKVKKENFPSPKSNTNIIDVDLKKEVVLDLFDSQLITRHLDIEARRLKAKGQGYYTIASSGHETNVVFGKVFPYKDMAFLHYRSGAFMVQRSKQKNENNFIRDVLLSIMASKDDPVAAGRHKVFGSISLNVPPQTSTIASHLPKAVGAALSIMKAKELKISSTLAPNGVVLCSFGDASFNHAVAQTAFNTAQWIAFHHHPLPLVFICEDNGLGISVPTPKEWIKVNASSRQGLTYLEADGFSLLDTYKKVQEANHLARVRKKPVFLHFRCVRLLGHAGSDIEQDYRSLQDIEQDEHNDPILHSARIILENNLLNKEEIIKLYQQLGSKVSFTAQNLVTSVVSLSSKAEVMSSLVPSRSRVSFFENQKIDPKKRQEVFGELWEKTKLPRTLAQCINYALIDILLQHKNTLIFGEDVAQKGGVYHVTSGLLKRFGQRRVFDTILDETMILGSAIGFAHNGFLPIPEIQFLSYYHNAQDQIRGEAASLSFFSNGGYQNPMVVRIPGLPYQQGFGGHFHNDHSIAIFRDVPSLIVACPSNGADAVMMLRSCVETAICEGRVIIFLEPIALYGTKDLYKTGDLQWMSTYPKQGDTIPLGEVGTHGQGKDLVIISYANGYYLSRKAAHILADKGIQVKVVDLRWLKPLPEKSFLQELRGYDKVLIVDECRKTGSLSEELVSSIYSTMGTQVFVERVVGCDSYIPLGKAANTVIPSCEDIVEAASMMLNYQT